MDHHQDSLISDLYITASVLMRQKLAVVISLARDCESNDIVQNVLVIRIRIDDEHM